MKTILPGQTIGIIGGGQLGRMMALAAKEAGFRIAVLDPVIDSPCGQVADIRIAALYDDLAALEELGEVSDVVTYEFENVDYEGLRHMERFTYLPQGAELVRITQNRILEKAEIRASGAPVAKYITAGSFEELVRDIGNIGFPCVVKTAFGGYDGKGQVKLHSVDDLEQAKGLFAHSACIAEEFVPFEREISVIIQRNAAGESHCLPTCENVHKNHILHETIVPARVPEAVVMKAQEAAAAIANHLQLVGTLAVEMFVMKEGGVLINELAPRPHNSGHYSIEACNISQFHQHIRAVCGWPLQKPILWKPAVMVNVLGEHIAHVCSAISSYPDWSFHLYGKAEAKEKRKMGHITVLTDDHDATLAEIDATGIWA